MSTLSQRRSTTAVFVFTSLFGSSALGQVFEDPEYVGKSLGFAGLIANDLNDYGEIAGAWVQYTSVLDPDPPYPVVRVPRDGAYVGDDGGAFSSLLPCPGGATGSGAIGEATSINNSGLVVGWCAATVDSPRHAVLWQRNEDGAYQVHELGHRFDDPVWSVTQRDENGLPEKCAAHPLTGYRSEAHHISETGAVLGTIAALTAVEPIIEDSSCPIELPPPGGRFIWERGALAVHGNLVAAWMSSGGDAYGVRFTVINEVGDQVPEYVLIDGAKQVVVGRDTGMPTGAVRGFDEMGGLVGVEQDEIGAAVVYRLAGGGFTGAGTIHPYEGLWSDAGFYYRISTHLAAEGAVGGKCLPGTNEFWGVLCVYLPLSRWGLPGGVTVFSNGGKFERPGTLGRVKAINALGQILFTTDVDWDPALVQPGSLVLEDPPVHPPVLSASDFDESTFENDPVNMFTGGFYLPWTTDLTLGGPFPLRFERMYDSGLRRPSSSGALGHGWRHNYQANLAVDEEGNVVVTLPQGDSARFSETSDGFVQSGTRSTRFQLVPSSGGYTFFDPAQELVYWFHGDGRLGFVEDRGGERHSLVYVIEGGGFRLSSINDGLGRSLTFSYDAQGRLTSVSDGARTVSFAHAGDELASVTNVMGHITRYEYAEHVQPGLLVREVRPLGNAPFTNAFDDDGRVISQSDGLARESLFTWSEDGLTVSVLYPDGSEVVHEHDESGRALSVSVDGETTVLGYPTGGGRAVTSSAGRVTTITTHELTGDVLDVSGPRGELSHSYSERASGGVRWLDLVSSTLPGGEQQSFTWDAAGRMLSATDVMGRTYLNRYDDDGRLAERELPNGGVLGLSYDAAGDLVERTDPEGGVTTFERDAAGRVVGVTFADGSSESAVYDESGRVVLRTDERGQTWSFAWDANGNPTSTTSPSGVLMRFSYDAMDRLSRIQDEGGRTAELRYDVRGQVVGTTDGLSNETTFVRDGHGDVVETVDALGHVWSRTTDERGLVLSSSDPLGSTVVNTWNDAGQLVAMTEPSGAETAFSYDEAGWLDSMTDALGSVTTWSRDAAGRVTAVALPEGITAAYEYGALDGLVAVTDAGGHVWHQEHDLAGRALALEDPLGRREEVELDSRGRIETLTSPTGDICEVSWEAAGLPSSFIWSDGTEISFEYDEDGRAMSATGLSFDYDAAGRLVGSNGLTATRDSEGRLSSVHYTADRKVDYGYDALGRVTSITDWLGGVTSFTYAANGRMTSTQRPNGVSSELSYDVDGRAAGVIERRDGQALASITLTRDAAGNITRREQQGHLAARFSNAISERSFDAAGQLEGTEHDAAGRVTRDGTRRYQWDAASRLRSLDTATGAVTYDYDASGRVTSRNDGFADERFTWGYLFATPALSIITRNGDDALYLIRAPSGELLYAARPDGVRRFFHFDTLGNTLLITDDDGAVVSRFAYEPYGALAGLEGEPSRFTFGARDGVMMEDRDLYRAGVRLYDAARQRFLSKDPARGQVHVLVLNPYSMANGNPLRFIDPGGRAPREQEQSGGKEMLDAASSSISAANFLLSGDSVDKGQWTTEHNLPGLLDKTTKTLNDAEGAAFNQFKKIERYLPPGELEKRVAPLTNAHKAVNGVGAVLEKVGQASDIWGAGSELYGMADNLLEQRERTSSAFDNVVAARAAFHRQVLQSLRDKTIDFGTAEQLLKAFDDQNDADIRSIGEDARIETHLIAAEGTVKVLKGTTPYSVQQAFTAAGVGN